MKEIDFVNKNCKLVFKRNNFVLKGVVLEQNEQGVIFKTSQKTAFISWDSIQELSLEGDY